MKLTKGFKKYFANTSWLFLERGVRMMTALLVGVYVARYLGPQNYGLLNYAGTFVSLFAVFASLGLNEIAIRNLVRDERNKESLLGTVFILKLLGVLLAIGIIYITVLFTSNDRFTNLLIYIIAFSMLFQPFNVIIFYFKAKVLSKYIVYVNIIVLIISSGIKLYFIYIKAPLLYFVVLSLFDSLMLAIGLNIMFRKQKLTIFRWKFDKMLAVEFLKDSWPMLLATVTVVIHFKIDIIMIKEMINNEAVGNYAAAVRLSEFWYFIPSLIASSLFPAIINAKKISNELYYGRLQKLCDLMALMSIIIAIPITFIANDIINLLYGSKYNQAGEILIIHIWSALPIFAGIVTGKWFVVENLQKYIFLIQIIGVSINISLNPYQRGFMMTPGTFLRIGTSLMYSSYRPYIQHSRNLSIQLSQS